MLCHACKMETQDIGFEIIDENEEEYIMAVNLNKFICSVQ